MDILRQINTGLVLWDLTLECNYRCHYCINSDRLSSVPISQLDYLDNMLRILDERNLKWYVLLTGGEPLLHPDFIRVCKKVTKKYRLIICTNLAISDKVEEFYNLIDPSMVDMIYSAIHIEEREKMAGVEEYIKNFKLLKNKNFNILATYILHPTVLDRYQEDFEYFSQNGIHVIPKYFIGWHKLKFYPNAYSRKIRRSISKYSKAMDFYPYYFKNKMCFAGKRFIYVKENGEVQRCVTDPQVLGSMKNEVLFYDYPQKCCSSRCICFGFDLLPHNNIQKKSNYSLFHEVQYYMHNQ